MYFSGIWRRRRRMRLLPIGWMSPARGRREMTLGMIRSPLRLRFILRRARTLCLVVP